MVRTSLVALYAIGAVGGLVVTVLAEAGQAWIAGIQLVAAVLLATRGLLVRAGALVGLGVQLTRVLNGDGRPAVWIVALMLVILLVVRVDGVIGSTPRS